MPLPLNKRLQTSQEVSPPVLSFTVQPTDTTIDYNGSASLVATATAKNPATNTASSGLLSYQWYRNGGLMSGETNSTLTLTNQIEAASYYCIVTYTQVGNKAPAINSPIKSNTITTTIRNYISITTQPSNKTITTGNSHTFNIVAIANDGNNSSLRYQWYVNGAQSTSTIGGTTSSLTLTTPAIGSYSVYCRVSQGGVIGQVAPSLDSNTVALTVNDYQCLDWNNSLNPGAITYVTTNTGDKPSSESIWYGVWEWGTNNDTCYISFSTEILGIYPRPTFSETWLPFSVYFQCNIYSSSAPDRYQIFKELNWGGSSPNQNSGDRKNLDFNTNNIDGQTNVWYGDNGRELFRATNTSKTAWGPDRGYDKVYWDANWGKPLMYIRVRRAYRKSNGQEINWFPTVRDWKDNNRLEYGRRYDPNV